jgi:hypothetical protein
MSLVYGWWRRSEAAAARMQTATARATARAPLVMVSTSFLQSHLYYPRWFFNTGVLSQCLLLWPTRWLGLRPETAVSAVIGATCALTAYDMYNDLCERPAAAAAGARSGGRGSAANEPVEPVWIPAEPAAPEVKLSEAEVKEDNMKRHMARVHPTFSPAEAARVVALFREADADNNGAIDVKELRGMLEKLGHPAAEADAARILSEVDLDKSGDLSFPEFAAVVAHVSRARARARPAL